MTCVDGQRAQRVAWQWQRNAMTDDDLGPALVNVDLRPLRLAYLIHAGSVEVRRGRGGGGWLARLRFGTE